MSLVDDNKENMLENDYLEVCNFLKNSYLQESAKNEDLYYISIEYVPGILEIIAKDIGKLPLHNAIVKYSNSREDITVDCIEAIIYDNVFDHLSIDCYQEIINAHGGSSAGMQKLKEYLDDEYIENIYNKGCKRFKCKLMAFHIIDCMIVEFDHITDEIQMKDAIDIEDLRYICDELMI